MQIAPDGKTLAVVQDMATSWNTGRATNPETTRTLRLLDLDSGEERHALEIGNKITPNGGSMGPLPMRFTPDGKVVVYKTWHFGLRACQLSDGKVVAGPYFGTVGISSIAFSPAGSTVAVGIADGAIAICDVDKWLAGRWSR